jgi:hypothetical protein
MSLSAGGSTATQATSSQLDPEIKNRWMQLEGRADDAYRDISTGVKSGAYNIDPSKYVAPLSDEQRQALTTAQYITHGDIGEGAVNAGVERAAGSPTALSISSDPRLQQAGAYYRPAYEIQESQVDPSQLPQLRAGTAAGGMPSYTNPWENQVVGQTTQDLYRAKQLTDQETAAAATQAGAFGGSRHGVADAETNKNFLDAVARSAGQLRQAGFTTEAGLGAADADRALSADASRYGTTAGILSGNADRSQNADLANASAENTAGLDYARASDAASASNADRILQALTSGGQLQLQSAQTLGGLGQSQRDFATSDYNLLKDAGTLTQGNDQAQRDANVTEINRRMQLPTQALNAYLPVFGSAVPTMSSGGTVNSKSKGQQVGAGIGG